MSVARVYNPNTQQWEVVAQGAKGEPGGSSWELITGKPDLSLKADLVGGLVPTSQIPPPTSHTHTMKQVTDLPVLETPTREASDRANKIAMRDSKGRLLSQNYTNAADVFATEAELPHTLASLWAARQVAGDVANARTPRIVAVTALPASPDPSTLYLITG